MNGFGNNDQQMIWPEWKVVRCVGRGSFGTVYEVKRNDLSVESHAAVKVISIPQDDSEIYSLRSEGMSDASIREYYKNQVDDFLSEIRLMESFKGTQSIVSVEDYKIVQNGLGWTIYIRMEMLTPFVTWLDGRTLSEDEVIRLGIDLCSALELCAQRNVIHRDIKPENIFVNSFGDFKLGDFGIATSLENRSILLSQKGTFNYMAPEIEKGEKYDATVDFYSLGLVLYRLLNQNRLPFLNSEQQLVSTAARMDAARRRLNGEMLPPPSEASPEMASVILKACAYYARDRFSSASEMKAALIRVKESEKKNAEEKNVEETNTGESIFRRPGVSELLGGQPAGQGGQPVGQGGQPAGQGGQPAGQEEMFDPNRTISVQHGYTPVIQDGRIVQIPVSQNSLGGEDVNMTGQPVFVEGPPRNEPPQYGTFSEEPPRYDPLDGSSKKGKGKKISLKLILIAAMSLLLCGVGGFFIYRAMTGKKIPAPDASAWTSADKIYVYSWDNDLKTKLDIVLEEYPEYKDYVEYVNLGCDSEQSLDPIDRALSSGNKYPSLIAADIGSAKYWIEDDSKTLDLYSIGFSESTLDDSYDFAKEFGSSGGKLKAVTWQNTAGSVFYNRKIAKNVWGTDDPKVIQDKLKDWDSFLSAAAELKKKNYMTVYSPEDVYYAIINSDREKWIKTASDGSKTFTPSSAIESYIEMTKKLYSGGYVSMGSRWDSGWYWHMKGSGNVFCYFGCPWMINVFQTNGAGDGEWGICEGPTDYYWGGTYISVGKDTNNPELCAFLLYELTCDPDIGVKITNRTGDAVNNRTANEMLSDGDLDEDNAGVKLFDGQNPYDTWAEASEHIDQSAVTRYDKDYEVFIIIAADLYYTPGHFSTVQEAIDYLKQESAAELGIPAE